MEPPLHGTPPSRVTRIRMRVGPPDAPRKKVARKLDLNTPPTSPDLPEVSVSIRIYDPLIKPGWTFRCRVWKSETHVDQSCTCVDLTDGSDCRTYDQQFTLCSCYSVNNKFCIKWVPYNPLEDIDALSNVEEPFPVRCNACQALREFLDKAATLTDTFGFRAVYCHEVSDKGMIHFKLSEHVYEEPVRITFNKDHPNREAYRRCKLCNASSWTNVVNE